jgi:hypothetical protein
MAEVTESLRRIDLLLQSLKALLECAARLQQPEQILGSCVFLSEELFKEFDGLALALQPGFPGEKPAND